MARKIAGGEPFKYINRAEKANSIEGVIGNCACDRTGRAIVLDIASGL
jgi:hypothetical protein